MPLAGGPNSQDTGYRRASILSLSADPLPSYAHLLFAHGIALLPALAFIILFVCLSLRIHCHLPHIGLTEQSAGDEARYGSTRCSTLLGPHSPLSWSLFALSVAGYTAAHKLRSLISHFSALLFDLLQTFAKALPFFSLGGEEDPDQDEKSQVIVACIAKAIFSELFKACLIVTACAVTLAKVHVDAVAADLMNDMSITSTFSPASKAPLSTMTNGVDLLDQIRWSMLDPQEASFRVVVWLALGWSIADFVRGTIQLYRHLAMYAPVYLPEEGQADEEEGQLNFWALQGSQADDYSTGTPTASAKDNNLGPNGKPKDRPADAGSSDWPPLTHTSKTPLPLNLSEYQRYGRQMILPSFGLEGQLKLRKARILVVGAGGLGCPAVQYLAAVGVGHISVMDHDVVERSNLARQILHTEDRIGLSKAESIQEAVKDINPHVTLQPIVEALTASNALSYVGSHDLTLDCTDNPLTRYLINDAAVLSDKMVVSGAGQSYEGQVMTLHRHLSTEGRGPCYRCVFPSSPKPSEVTNCEDSGVLGTVTGLVGTLQAMETIKLVVGLGDAEERPTMLLVSPLSTTPFRTVKIRPRRENCAVCGDEGSGGGRIKSLADEDYVAFCGLETAGQQPQKGELGREETAKQLAQAKRRPDVLVDVRTEEEFGITKLQGVTNIPYSDIRRDPSQALSTIETLLPASTSGSRHLVHLVCTRGNDSRLSSSLLTAESRKRQGRQIDFVNVKGGLRAWQQEVDEGFPNYWGGGGGSDVPVVVPQGEARRRSKAILTSAPAAEPAVIASSSGVAPALNGKSRRLSLSNDDGASSSSVSSTSSSDESELSMIAHLEDQIDRLVAARTRVKLEQSLGASLPELPSALAALWRLDAALWSIGSLLLLSSSLALAQGPLFSLGPPRRHDGAAVLFPSLSSLWVTYVSLSALHATSDAIWKLALPTLGWATVTYGSLLVGIGMVVVGLARWGCVV